ncbi:MAG: PKD domain-containing protein, partial [Acidobacteriota bacterium]
MQAKKILSITGYLLGVLLVSFLMGSSAATAATVPVPGFNADALSGPAPLAVTFANATVGTVDKWLWKFGDGGASTAKNPTHTYNFPGIYTVSLTATGPGGTATVERTSYINVGYPGPSAQFTTRNPQGPVPFTVYCKDLSTGPIAGWYWDFGDGTSSMEQDPNHQYTQNGTYTVSLT